LAVAAAEWPTFAITSPLPRGTSTVVLASIIATGGTLSRLGVRLRRTFLLAAASGTRPCGSQCKTGQQVTQWIFLGIAHGAHSSGRF
jgi:hypothetical protein